MLKHRFVVGIVSLATIVLGASMVSGQTYPSKPIRMVTGAPGANNDFLARLIAQGISDPLGQPVIVDNRSPILAAEAVSKAPPDGYTLVVATGSLWLSPFLRKTPYDPARDFSPITLVATSPNVVVVHPSLPVKSITELIALAKVRPGELNYGSPAPGSANHLAGELFKAMAGVNIVGVPYKGMGPVIIAMISGEMQLMFSATAPAVPHIKSGRLRALATTSAQPSVLLPGLPAVAATLPGYESILITGILAPGKTPAAIISRLSQETVRFLNRADVKEKLFNARVDAVGSSPEQFAATIQTEMARMGKVIKDVGIRAE